MALAVSSHHEENLQLPRNQEIQVPVLSELKYLGFVEIATDKASKYVANIYGFAKESSGFLKPSVEGVETTVRTAVKPVYERMEGKPHEILLFVDKKVDNAVGGILDGILPQALKEKSFQACDVARQVPEAVKAVVNELQTNGLISTAKTFYASYEPMAEELTYTAWKRFLKLPYAPRAIHLAAPPTLFCAEKFNLLVHNLKELQVPLADYIPVVPLEKIEKAAKA